MLHCEKWWLIDIVLRQPSQVQIRHLWKGKNSAKWTPPFEVKRKKPYLDVTPSTVFWAYEICTSTMFNKRVALFMAYSRCGDDNFFSANNFFISYFLPSEGKFTSLLWALHYNCTHWYCTTLRSLWKMPDSNLGYQCQQSGTLQMSHHIWYWTI